MENAGPLYTMTPRTSTRITPDWLKPLLATVTRTVSAPVVLPAVMRPCGPTLMSGDDADDNSPSTPLLPCPERTPPAHAGKSEDSRTMERSGEES